MTDQHIRRAIAVLVSASLLTSLAAATVANPTSAAKPKCLGKTATIVGSAKGEVIKGTPKADVIVARGGHDIVLGLGGADIICGNSGNDKLVGGSGNDRILGHTGRDQLFGGPGRDWLAGGPNNDRFHGGTGNDACLQGSGSGPRLACERPPVVVPAPEPVPAPPPPTPQTFARAYSDLDGSGSFNTGDVLISKLVDTNLDGTPSKGDTVVMGRWPTNWHPGPTDFRDWAVRSHTVEGLAEHDDGRLHVDLLTGDSIGWMHSHADFYFEWAPDVGGPPAHYTQFFDLLTAERSDEIGMDALSPSRPITPIPYGFLPSTGDASFINVDILY